MLEDTTDLSMRPCSCHRFRYSGRGSVGKLLCELCDWCKELCEGCLVRGVIFVI